MGCTQLLVRHFLKWKDAADVGRRTAAASALARAYLGSELDVDERVAAEAALTLLVEDPSPKVRLALAEALSTSHDAPVQVITALARDQAEIAGLVIGRSPVIGERDMIERARNASSQLQCLIAARPEVPHRLALALARNGSAQCAATLLANANARVDADVRQVLVDRFADVPAVRGALLDRAGLEPHLRYRLLKAAGAALAESGLLQRAVGADAASPVMRDNEQRALCTLLADPPADDGDALIDAIRQGGDLTAVLLVRLACHGQIDFLARLFADLAGLPVRRVTALLAQDRPTQLRALLARAGLAQSVQPVLMEAIGLWREVAIGRLAAGVQEVTRRIIEAMHERDDRARDAANDDILDLLRAIHVEAMRDNARAHARALAAA